jgi:hypothetical protein
MANKRELIGYQVGKLTVIDFHGNLNGRPAWMCRCECGNTKIYQGKELTKKRRPPQTCGCGKKNIDPMAALSHGKSGSKEYHTWQQIRQRCYNPKNPLYGWYGGRGITVSKEWVESFETFYADMGDAPSAEHTIERVDNSLGYGKDNCKWATMKEQAQNRRTPKKSGVIPTLGESR